MSPRTVLDKRVSAKSCGEGEKAKRRGSGFFNPRFRAKIQTVRSASVCTRGKGNKQAAGSGEVRWGELGKQTQRVY